MRVPRGQPHCPDGCQGLNQGSTDTGPGRALAGAAVGGGLIGASVDVVFDDPRLDDFASSLGKDTSALVLVGEEATLAEFGAAVEPFDGGVIDTDLNEDDIKALRKVLKS